tara:strand:+ start:721 stop:858 length:138 start_codon:yes stop_codon:yes gene_type:complete
MNPVKQHKKLIKYAVQADKCLSRKKAQKILSKVEKAMTKLSSGCQ